MTKRQLIGTAILICLWVPSSFVLCKYPFKIAYQVAHGTPVRATSEAEYIDELIAAGATDVEIAILLAERRKKQNVDNLSQVNDNIIRLYDNLAKDGYELSSLDQFALDMYDSTKAQRLYITLSKDGYELPTPVQFYKDISPISEDIRSIVKDMIQTGESDEDIDLGIHNYIIRSYKPPSWVEYFNVNLFIILNLMGFSFLTIFIISLAKRKLLVLFIFELITFLILLTTIDGVTTIDGRVNILDTVFPDKIDLFITINVLFILPYGIYFIYAKWKKHYYPYLLLVTAWQLLSFSLANYFYAIKSDHGGEEEFNEKLFITLNILGLAILLIIIAYRLLRSNNKSDND